MKKINANHSRSTGWDLSILSLYHFIFFRIQSVGFVFYTTIQPENLQLGLSNDADFFVFVLQGETGEQGEAGEKGIAGEKVT